VLQNVNANFLQIMLNLITYYATSVKTLRHIIIIIITHLLHENKSQVLTIQMADMQMEQARSYELIQGLVPKAG